MSMLTSHSSHVNPHCSNASYEELNSTWVKENAIQKCPSPVMCSRGSWMQQCTCLWPATSISKWLPLQHFQVSSGVANSPYSLPRPLTPVFTHQELCQVYAVNHALSYVVLTVLSSKMDPFRKGVTITIASAPGAHTCAVAALKSLFRYCEWPPKSPLFSKDNGSPLSS